MKTVLVFLNFYVTICKSLQFPDLKLQNYYVPMVNKGVAPLSIMYVMENNNHLLINSILTDLYINQSVLLLSGENIINKEQNNINPNIIVLTESLDTQDLGTEAFKTILVSQWSYLYLVIATRNDYYSCENGSLNINAYAETKYYLNELWQMFKIARVTVSFPYTCPKHYVIYDGKESSGTDIYNRSIKLIRPNNNEEFESAIAHSGNPRVLAENFPLRINMFYRFPTSIIECNVVDHYTKLDADDATTFCGLDGLMMRDYCSHYKYDLSVSTDEGCDKYGFVDTANNNVTTGSLGCIIQQKIDISFNSRFIWAYSSENYYFLHYVSQDSLCAIMKSPNRIPLWHYATNMFTLHVWMALLALLAFLGTATWLLAKISAMFSDERPLKLHQYILHTIHSALIGVLAHNDGRFLILKGTCLLSSIILLAIYQGHLNYQFTTRSHYPEIKTLRQLYDSSVVLYTSPSIMEILRYSVDLNNANQEAFMKRVQLRETTATEYVINNENTATVSRKQDVKIEVLKNHNTDKYGSPQIYVIEECFQTFFLSYIARSGFLFIEESLIFMLHLLEAGLPNQYYIWTRRTYNLADKYPSNGPEPRPYNRVKLKKLRTAFAVLAVGYMTSGLVFIIEKWRGRNRHVR